MVYIYNWLERARVSWCLTFDSAKFRSWINILILSWRQLWGTEYCLPVKIENEICLKCSLNDFMTRSFVNECYPLALSKLAQFTILSIELFSILLCLDIIIFFNELIKVGIFRNYVVKFWCTVLWKKKKGVRNVMYYITNWVISVANVWEKYGLKSCFYTDKLHIILNLVGQDLINHLNHASIHFS